MIKNWNVYGVKLGNFYRKEQNFKCSYCKREVSYVSASNAKLNNIISKVFILNFMFEEKTYA